jgi:GTP-binding protein
LSRFVDEADITVRSGNGGRGAVSFRREKYVPKGGPDGGDGGDGGDVIFRVENNMRSLYDHWIRKVYRAKNGSAGSRRNMKGSKGADCVIPVPRGTVILEKKSQKLLADLTGNTDLTGAADRLNEVTGELKLLAGGRGGHGNAHFATSTNRSPRYAQDGTPGSELEITLQIKTIADVGLVGLPNSGKSTLLSVLTEARPKIGQYPFTTLTPNLGVMNYKNEKQVVIADVPGLIEGASSGVGLGIRFLKHIERTRVLIVLVELSEGGYMKQYEVLESEMRQYSGTLLDKPRIIAGSKCDVIGRKEEAAFLEAAIPGEKICISSMTRFNIEILKNRIVLLLGKNSDKTLS